MSELVKDLIKQGDQLFNRRGSLLSYWQEVADNFYVERADFTTTRTLGQDFAGHLTTSRPLLARRDLGNIVQAMLRPRDSQWFHMGLERDEQLDNSGRMWLESRTRIMRRAMYDINAQFVRATKEGDNDFITFGQTVISKELTKDRRGLIFRCWHLRDVAWSENEYGKPTTIHRMWKPSINDLKNEYGAENLAPKLQECLSDSGKDKYRRVSCRHIVMPVEDYMRYSTDGKKFNTPFVSIYIDVENEHIIEEAGSWTKIYTIPRWQTVSGSQYAYSPATVAALPDARLLQSISLTLLEAGEKVVNPPMVATKDAIRSDIGLYAGGVTWVSSDYNERNGAALRPAIQDFSGLPYGDKMFEDVHHAIKEAFFLNSLMMPPADGGGDMTAYEVGQRVQEYIRNAMPLFEPMEQEYNGDMCDDVFMLMQMNGGFGSLADMPQSLRGQDVKFNFESPLHEAIDRKKANTFMETRAMLAEAIAMDPNTHYVVDATTALRETLGAIRTPATWLRDEEQVGALVQQQAEQIQAAQLIQQMKEGGEAATAIGEAAQTIAQ